MADNDAENKDPALPPNYVSIAQLQQRWLKRKQQQEEEQKKQNLQEKAAEKQPQGEEKVCEKGKNKEDVKLRKDQNFDRSEYFRQKPFEKEKGNYKEKGVSTVEKYVENGLKSSGGASGNSGEIEGRGGKIWGKSCGDGGGGSVCTVEKEIPVVVSGEEGFSGGSKRNGGDGRLKFGGFENVGKGEELEGKAKGLEGEKKGRDTRLLMENRKESSNGRGPRGRYRGKQWMLGEKGWARVKVLSLEEVRNAARVKEANEGTLGVTSRGNEGKDGYIEGLHRNCDDGGDKGEVLEKVSERKGVDEKGTKGILGEKGTSDLKNLSVEEVRNGNERAKARVNVGKEGNSGVRSGENIGKGGNTSGLQRNGNAAGEKREVLEKVGEGKDVEEKGLCLEVEKEENQRKGTRVGVKGNYRRNRGKKGDRKATVQRYIERERARENEAAEATLVVVSGKDGEKDRMSAGLKRNGGNQIKVERKGLGESEIKLGGEKVTEDEGLLMKSHINGRRARFISGHRVNLDKEGVARAKVRRDDERENANENEAAEETPVVVNGNNGEKEGYTAGLKRDGNDQIENGETLVNVLERKGLERTEENLGGEKETADEGLLMTRQRNAGKTRFTNGYRGNLDNKGMPRARFRQYVERERTRDHEAAQESLVLTSGKMENGNGDDQIENGETLVIVLEGKGLEGSEEKLGGEKETEDEGLVMTRQPNAGRARITSGYRRNLDKKGMPRERVKQYVERERTRDNEAAKESLALTSGKMENGNGNDQMEHGKSLKSVMGGKGSEESAEKPGGEKEMTGEGLATAIQRNGERVRFRRGYPGNRDKKGVAEAKLGRTFENFSLNDGRKGEVKGRDIVDGRKYRKSARFGGDRMKKQSDSGLMWVKKGGGI